MKVPIGRLFIEKGKIKRIQRDEELRENVNSETSCLKLRKHRNQIEVHLPY